MFHKYICDILQLCQIFQNLCICIYFHTSTPTNHKISKKLEISNNPLDLAVDLGESGRELHVLEVEVIHHLEVEVIHHLEVEVIHLLEVAEDLGEPARELLVLKVKVSHDRLDKLGKLGRELLDREAVLWDQAGHQEQVLLGISLLQSSAALISLLNSTVVMGRSWERALKDRINQCSLQYSPAQIRVETVEVPMLPKPGKEVGAVENDLIKQQLSSSFLYLCQSQRLWGKEHCSCQRVLLQQGDQLQKLDRDFIKQLSPSAFSYLGQSQQS